MKCLSIAIIKQNGHTRTPSLPTFLAFNVSPRSSCELVIPEKTYSPFEPCFSRSSRLISRLSLQVEVLLVSNLHQDIWLRFFLSFFLSRTSREECVVFEILRCPHGIRGFSSAFDPSFLSVDREPPDSCETRRFEKNAREKNGLVISRVFHHLGMACVAVHKNPLMNIPAGFLSRKIVAGRSESFCMLDSHEPWERRFRGPCVLPARDRGTWAKKSLLLATVITRETFDYLDTIRLGKGSNAIIARERNNDI